MGPNPVTVACACPCGRTFRRSATMRSRGGNRLYATPECAKRMKLVRRALRYPEINAVRASARISPREMRDIATRDVPELVRQFREWERSRPSWAGPTFLPRDSVRGIPSHLVEAALSRLPPAFLSQDLAAELGISVRTATGVIQHLQHHRLVRSLGLAPGSGKRHLWERIPR